MRRSWLNDVAGRHVKPENIREALRRRQRPVAEGSVGGGTGMICSDFKRASALVAEAQPALGGYTVGVLVMSTRHMRDLRVAGLPVGPLLEPRYRHLHKRASEYGSIIAVFATDAPLSSHSWGASPRGGVGSGAPAASRRTGRARSSWPSPPRTDPAHDAEDDLPHEAPARSAAHPLYEAAIEATEEAILNSLCMAREMEGANGNFAPALRSTR